MSSVDTNSMPVTEIIQKRIYKIDVPLPHSPLKNLNSYIVIGDNRNLLVDTGFNRPECSDALKSGLAALNLDMNKTDIFLTHVHSDHSGLAAEFAAPGTKIYMNPIDKKILDWQIEENGSFWTEIGSNLRAEGFPEKALSDYLENNPARIYASKKGFESIPVNNMDKLRLEPFEFTCLHMPGHTPGHICLYLEEYKLMFLGDHILFGISPNITSWHDGADYLGKYLASLKEIKKYDIQYALTSHRAINQDARARAEELLEHHAERLIEVYDIIKAQNGITAHDVASKMKWSIRSKGWEDFPVAQKGFAVGEAIAHVRRLLEEGIVKRYVVDGKSMYYVSN